MLLNSINLLQKSDVILGKPVISSLFTNLFYEFNDISALMLEPLRIKMICFQSQGVDGFVICAGLTSQYCLLNYESGQFTDLFPIDTDNTMPIVKRISKVSQNPTV